MMVVRIVYCKKKDDKEQECQAPTYIYCCQQPKLPDCLCCIHEKCRQIHDKSEYQYH